MREAAEQWSIRLADLAAAARVPGASLAIWAGGEQILAACGVLSTATGVAVTPDAVFQIGSITKVWTATMIMQLVDEGRLTLDTTVSQLLPGLRLTTADTGGEVTIGQLLTHTSGIDGDIFTDTGRGAGCIERYASELAQAAQICRPGQAYSYCNSGFVLLGRIIEVLDGREWNVSLRDRVSGPLGLAQTVILPEEAIMHRAAVGHREHPDEDVPVSVWGLPRSMGPAGLITASARDVLTFARAHLGGGALPDGGQLISQAAVAAMQQPRVTIPGDGARGGSVGLAWRRFRCGDREIIGHDGSTIGQCAYLRADPVANVIACLLTNSAAAGMVAQELFSEIFMTYAGISLPHGPGPAAGPDAIGQQRHTGRYERAGRRLDVYVRDGQLRMLVTLTGARAVFSDGDPEEVVLHPADALGDSFVCRSHDGEPWIPVSFGLLDAQIRYLFTGGRITPRSG